MLYYWLNYLLEIEEQRGSSCANLVVGKYKIIYAPRQAREILAKRKVSTNTRLLLDDALVGVFVLERAVDELKLLTEVQSPRDPDGHHIAVV